MMCETAYPTFGVDPMTGEFMSTDDETPPCKKCRCHGKVREFKIIKPCTICAMKNKGKWGWEEGHLGEEDYLQNENGALPGRCGVQECLKRNKIAGEFTGNESKTLNEQVILGFAQYALYNHLKWNDILYPSEGVQQNHEEYKRKYCPEDTSDIDDHGAMDNAWFWWKMIPRGICLSNRLNNILKQMIVLFHDSQHENCVVQTTQKLNGELSDDIWSDFFDTYVEPIHVAHLFMITLEKLIECDDEVEYNLVNIYPNDILADDFGAIDRKWINETSSYLQYGVNFLKYIFYKKINYEIEENEPSREKTKVVKIIDRDMFGTYLDDVTEYDWIMSRPWYRRNDIWYPVPNIIEANGEDRRRNGWEKELWNFGVNDDLHVVNFLQDEVRSFLGFSSTYFWEDILRGTNDILESDYENERSFNQYLQSIDPSEVEDYHSITMVVNDEDDWARGAAVWMNDLEEWNALPVARQLVFENDNDSDISISDDESIEYEPSEIQRNTDASEKKLTDVIEKLKELQVFVDDSIKTTVTEGQYLELVNKILDVYKTAK